MSNEEFERKMEFILNAQAQFSVDLQHLAEVQRRSEEKWARTEEKWARTEEGIRSLLSIAEIHEREIEALKEMQERQIAEANRRSAETDRKMSETDRKMSETDERLNALINMVEKYLADRRNGKDDERRGN